jgi:hypothetical protein
MPPEGFRCRQCGNCCINLSSAYETSAAEEDIVLWQAEERDDILEWISFIEGGWDESGKMHYIYDIWIDPRIAPVDQE